MASSPLSLQPLHPFTGKPHQNLNSELISFQFHPRNTSIHRSRNNAKRSIFAIPSSSSSSSSSNWEKEEQRWLREEQRWIREENRWIREQSRWNAERESLLREIAGLKLRIEALESQISAQGGSAVARDAVFEVEALVQVLKEAGLDLAKMNRIAESGGSGSDGPRLLESEGEAVKEMVVSEVKVSEGRVEEKKKRVSLRMGSEGVEVREMQEALLKLGFYSGEEDMEYSTFSSGTERAVKTWQSTLGSREDGIMTSDLLERLFMEQVVADASVSASADYGVNSDIASEKVSSNGISAASVTEVSEIQHTIIKESENSEVEVSHHRVYLLGENRWEEPSRLTGRDKKVGMNNSPIGTKKCMACRGEGRLLCMECDGTGEPNIEPQFLEWVGEDTKCPYCEGQGYTICDVCEGKQVIPI